MFMPMAVAGISRVSSCSTNGRKLCLLLDRRLHFLNMGHLFMLQVTAFARMREGEPAYLRMRIQPKLNGILRDNRCADGGQLRRQTDFRSSRVTRGASG